MKYVRRYMHKDIFKCPTCKKMYPTDDIHWYPIKKIIPHKKTPWSMRWIITCDGRCSHCETALGIQLGHLDVSTYGPLDKFLFKAVDTK